MHLEGMKTIYMSEVAYVNSKQNIAPQAMTPKEMINFCAPSDADQIFDIAKQVVPDATLQGTTGKFSVTWNPGTSILQPGQDEVYAVADSSGGAYMYQNEHGYRPIRIQSLSKGLDQYMSELVASYAGQTGMSLVKTAQGMKLQWM